MDKPAAANGDAPSLSAEVDQPGGWDASTDLGPAWSLNWPLQAPTLGIALT